MCGTTTGCLELSRSTLAPGLRTTGPSGRETRDTPAERSRETRRFISPAPHLANRMRHPAFTSLVIIFGMVEMHVSCVSRRCLFMTHAQGYDGDVVSRMWL